MESKSITKFSEKESKVDTRYYDELFTKIKDDQEFKDAEELGKEIVFPIKIQVSQPQTFLNHILTLKTIQK
jgi:hypothetical protein